MSDGFGHFDTCGPALPDCCLRAVRAWRGQPHCAGPCRAGSRARPDGRARAVARAAARDPGPVALRCAIGGSLRCTGRASGGWTPHMAARGAGRTPSGPSSPGAQCPGAGSGAACACHSSRLRFGSPRRGRRASLPGSWSGPDRACRQSAQPRPDCDAAFPACRRGIRRDGPPAALWSKAQRGRGFDALDPSLGCVGPTRGECAGGRNLCHRAGAQPGRSDRMLDPGVGS